MAAVVSLPFIIFGMFLLLIVIVLGAGLVRAVLPKYRVDGKCVEIRESVGTTSTHCPIFEYYISTEKFTSVPIAYHQNCKYEVGKTYRIKVLRNNKTKVVLPEDTRMSVVFFSAIAGIVLLWFLTPMLQTVTEQLGDTSEMSQYLSVLCVALMMLLVVSIICIRGIRDSRKPQITVHATCIRIDVTHSRKHSYAHPVFEYYVGDRHYSSRCRLSNSWTSYEKGREYDIQVLEENPGTIIRKDSVSTYVFMLVVTGVLTAPFIIMPIISMLGRMK